MAKKTFYRSLDFTQDSVNMEARTIELSFSSEEPYERYSHKYGAYLEILGHRDGEVDLSWISSGAAPLLIGHDVEKQVGVVSSVVVDGERATALVRVSRSQSGTDLLNDVADGIKTSISVGYTIAKEQVEGEIDGKKKVRVTKWSPREISFVSIPADITVGVGRADEEEEQAAEINKTTAVAITISEETNMENVEKNLNVEEITREARKSEQARVREISALGAKFGQSKAADEFVRNDKPAEEFRAYVLENLDLSAKQTAVKSEAPAVDMSTKERAQYSFMRAIRAQLGDSRMVKEAGLEIEVSRALADVMGVEAKGIMVPHDMMIRAPLSAGGASNGANIVQTDHGSFIELLRNRMVMTQAGATILSGLRGNLALPKSNTGAQAYWVNEVTGVTASDPKMTQVTFSPKTVGTYVDATRTLVLQGSLDIEAYLRNELTKTLAVELDRVGLYGNVALGEPGGIVFATGLNTVAIPASAPTYGNVWSMIASVEADNALEGSIAFVTSPVIRAAMATTTVDGGSGRFIYENGQVAGYRAISSNQCLATDLFFGDFSSAIYALWGGLDIVVSTEALATSGGIRVIALQAADFNVRYGESFCLAR